MAYSLQDLENLLKNSSSVKALTPELQKRFSDIINSSDVALKRKLYFILTDEKQWVAKIDRNFRKEANAIFNLYETNLTHITQKQKYVAK